MADWGAMMCLLAAPWVQLSASAGNEWMAASLTHVSGAIGPTSVQVSFIFTFNHIHPELLDNVYRSTPNNSAVAKILSQLGTVCRFTKLGRNHRNLYINIK